MKEDVNGITMRQNQIFGDETSNSSSDSNSSHEKGILDSKTEETSYNEYKNDSKDLSQIGSAIDTRRKSSRPDKSDNFIKRRKIHTEETGRSIVTSNAFLQSVTEPSTSRDNSSVDCPEMSDSDDSLSPSQRKRIMNLLNYEGPINIDEMLEKELSRTVRYPPLKDSYEDVFADLEDTSFPEPYNDSVDLEDISFPEILEDIFSTGKECTSFSRNEIDIEHDYRQVTNATTKSEHAELRNKFLSQLQKLSQSCIDHNSGRKRDSKMEFKVEKFLTRIFVLGKYKVLSNEEDSHIASLIMPVIKHIVFIIELSVVNLKSRTDLLQKKSALKFLVDIFGQLPVGKKLPQGENLSYFLEKPIEYCNSLLDNVLLNRKRISTYDEYDDIDNYGIPESHCWWYKKEYLHDMMPNENALVIRL